jgi:CheY-like chemotaxis protein
MILQNTGELLSHWGMVATTARNGAEALALASERQFDIIVMDIAMPVMDGLEATRRIRQLEIEHPERPHTPIVAYTTGWLLADTALLARVGFDEAINKPSDADQLKACLRRWSLTTTVQLS